MNNIKMAFDAFHEANNERYEDLHKNGVDSNIYKQATDKARIIEQGIMQVLMNAAPEGVDPALFAECVNIEKLQKAVMDTALVSIARSYVKTYMQPGDYINSFGLACALYDNGFVDTHDYTSFDTFRAKVSSVVVPTLMNAGVIVAVPTTYRHSYTSEYKFDDKKFACVRIPRSSNLYYVK